MSVFRHILISRGNGNGNGKKRHELTGGDPGLARALVRSAVVEPLPENWTTIFLMREVAQQKVVCFGASDLPLLRLYWVALSLPENAVLILAGESVQDPKTGAHRVLCMMPGQVVRRLPVRAGVRLPTNSYIVKYPAWAK